MRDADRQFHEYVSTRLERWRRSAYLLCQHWHTADDVVSVMVGRLYDHWRTGLGRPTISMRTRSGSSPVPG